MIAPEQEAVLVPLTRVSASNFKSFRKLVFELGQFNVILGANASGKSNLISLLGFLRAIPPVGLDNAVRMAGGPKLIRNLRSSETRMKIELVATNPIQATAPPLPTRRARASMNPPESQSATYTLEIDLADEHQHPHISRESLLVTYDSRLGTSSGKAKSRGEKVEIRLERSGNRVHLDTKTGKLVPSDVRSVIEYLEAIKSLPIAESVCLLDNPTTRPFAVGAFPDLFNGSFYSLEPRREKEISPSFGPPALNVDGGNLANIVAGIIELPARKQRLLTLVRDLLPFIEDIRTISVDSSLLLQVRETSSGENYIPASSVSDGTVNIISMVIGFYFEKKPLVVIEEPEKSVHPRLLGRIVDAAKSVSSDTQIIITTHSPEVVREAGLESILLLERGEDGESRLTRPADSARVKEFVKDQVGLSDLFLLDQLS